MLKTLNFENLEFSFSVHFSKFSRRPQAKLNTIHENFGVLIFHSLPVSMQYMPSICDVVFHKSITQYSCFHFFL